MDQNLVVGQGQIVQALQICTQALIGKIEVDQARQAAARRQSTGVMRAV